MVGLIGLTCFFHRFVNNIKKTNLNLSKIFGKIYDKYLRPIIVTHKY